MFVAFITSVSFIIGGYYLLEKLFPEYIEIKYQKWVSLNSMMASKYKSPTMVKIMSLYMICKFCYLQTLQYLTNTVVKIDKNSYEISYIINGKIYKMVVKPERGPLNYYKILNDKNENIIDEICQYYGPHYKNQVKLTPSFFKTSHIKIVLFDDSEQVFGENEKLIL
jgi:hypothetical protein